jgi:hypothetical protein
MVTQLKLQDGTDMLFNDMQDFINFGIVIDPENIEALLLDPELANTSFTIGNNIVTLESIYRAQGQLLIPANDRNTSIAITRLRREASKKEPTLLGLKDSAKVLGTETYTLINMFKREEGIPNYIEVNGIAVPLFHGTGGKDSTFRLTEAGVEIANLILSFNEYFTPTERNKVLGGDFSNIIKIIAFIKEFIMFASSIFNNSSWYQPNLNLLAGIISDEDISLLREAMDSMEGKQRINTDHRGELGRRTIPLFGKMFFAAAAFHSRAKELPRNYTNAE